MRHTNEVVAGLFCLKHILHHAPRHRPSRRIQPCHLSVRQPPPQRPQIITQLGQRLGSRNGHRFFTHAPVYGHLGRRFAPGCGNLAQHAQQALCTRQYLAENHPSRATGKLWGLAPSHAVLVCRAVCERPRVVVVWWVHACRLLLVALYGS